MNQQEKGQAILEKLEFVLKDSDDLQMKKRVRQYMKDFTEVFTFKVLGAEKTGKTTFIRSMFLKDSSVGSTLSECPGGQKEYRYGDYENAVSIDKDYVRHFIPVRSIEGLSIFEISEEMGKKNKDVSGNTDALFVLLAADDIQNPYVWDIIEHAGYTPVICILSKADLCTGEELKVKSEKIKGYLREAGLNAPLFAVSGFDQQKGEIEGGFEEVEEYIRTFITGNHPLMGKWEKNMADAREILAQLEQSFAKRKQQYDSDRKILTKIDGNMDTLRMEQTEHIRKLKERVLDICGEEIDHYRDTMITSLDPAVIKRNFTDQHACLEWMKNKADICEKNLNEKVTSKMNQLYRTYIRELTEIYEESLSFFENRELLLDAEDHFYGTLAESKRSVSKRTQEVVKENKKQYGELLQVSEQYMNALWNAADKRDAKNENFQSIAGMTGTGVSVAGATGAVWAYWATAAKFILPTAIGTGALGLVLGVGLSIVLYEMIKPYVESNFSNSMEKENKKQTEAYKQQIENLKEDMSVKLQERIAEMFAQEIDTMDKSFMEFRMSVNIDMKNIPNLSKELEGLKILTAD